VGELDESFRKLSMTLCTKMYMEICKIGIRNSISEYIMYAFPCFRVEINQKSFEEAEAAIAEAKHIKLA
jgi:DNA primase large subunit